jgi:hypothetical protein
VEGLDGDEDRPWAQAEARVGAMHSGVGHSASVGIR